jgi:hypothetical protein
VEPPQQACSCKTRAVWARVDDDDVMQWPVVELAEWEELRRCPVCDSVWLAIWPEEVEGGMVFCRPQPGDIRRLRDLDRAATMRGYCLARLEEHYGSLNERKADCRKVGCHRNRIAQTGYCIEHLIAERFGRHLSKLDASK